MRVISFVVGERQHIPCDECGKAIKAGAPARHEEVSNLIWCSQKCERAGRAQIREARREARQRREVMA